MLAAALKRQGHAVDLRSVAPSVSRISRSYEVVIEDELGFRRWQRLNAALVRTRSPVRRVALVHVTSTRLSPSRATVAGERAFLRTVDAAIFVSEQVRAETSKLLKVRVRSAVVRPGCDRLPRVRRSPPQSGPLRFICVGHLLVHKRQLELLEAAPADVRLVLAGAGQDRRYTARIRAQLRGMPNARWVGALNAGQLARALARADVFLSAAPYESYGIAAAEAQAAGLPVMACTAGGLWELLSPGVDALQFAPEDLSGMVRAMGELSGALLARLRAGARAAKRRTWARAAREFSAALRGFA
jgi:glycosyltransferase involved in cell wall biosynthesis